jgi:hypothetical protein
MLANSLAAIHAIRPDLGLRSRAILEAILFVEGPVGSMESLARLLGLRNRFALARLLRRDKLPPLRRLAAWASILSWVQSAERDGASLCRLALRSRRYPSACYRLVKEITGLRWEVVRRRGSQWIEKQLLREFVGKKRRTVPACHS